MIGGQEEGRRGGGERRSSRSTRAAAVREPSGNARGRLHAFPGFAALSGMGVMSALGLTLGFGGGWLLDRHLGTSPAFTLAGLAVGVALAGLGTYLEIKKHFVPAIHGRERDDASSR